LTTDSFYKIVKKERRDDHRLKLNKEYQMQYGMVIGESNNAYHGNAVVSTSTIKDFIKSKYLFYRKYIAKDVVREESDAMRFGSAFHELILEPEKFHADHDIIPEDIDRRTKEGKAAYAELEASGKRLIKHADFLAMEELADSIKANPTAAILLTNGVAEVSWRIQAGAFAMQSRTDWFIEACSIAQAEELNRCGIRIKVGQPIVVDLKTTQEIEAWTRGNYSNAIYQYGYQLQLAFYLAVINKIRIEQGKEPVRHFLFVVVEKQAPNDCAVIALDEATFGMAQTQLKYHLAELGKCYASGKWEGYKDKGVIVTGIPEQIIGREEQAIFEARDFTKIGFE